MSCYHGNVSAKTCAAKTCQHNRRTTFASSLEPPHFAPNTALLTIPKSLLTNPRVSLSATQRTHFFALKSFCQNRSRMSCHHGNVQQKYVPQKNVSITTARHSPHPRAPPFAPNTALWTMQNGPLTNPTGFHCPQPSELIFLPSNLFAKTDPGCPATTAMFQRKYVPQKHVSIITARHSPDPSSPALCAQHRSMDHAKRSHGECWVSLASISEH